MQRPTIGPLNYAATNGARGHMKRPSFAWLQPLHSPRKGLFTIVLIVGSFLVTWLPTSARHRLQKITLISNEELTAELYAYYVLQIYVALEGYLTTV